MRKVIKTTIDIRARNGLLSNRPRLKAMNGIAISRTMGFIERRGKWIMFVCTYIIRSFNEKRKCQMRAHGGGNRSVSSWIILWWLLQRKTTSRGFE